jgi:hypothetical protein
MQSRLHILDHKFPFYAKLNAPEEKKTQASRRWIEGAWDERNKMGFSFFFFKCKDDFEKTRVQRRSFESVLAGPISILGSASMGVSAPLST